MSWRNRKKFKQRSVWIECCDGINMNKSLPKFLAMNKSELIEKIAKRTLVLTRDDAESSVNVILGAISEQLASNGRIEIRGFGSFALNHRRERRGRNPKTGETVMVPAKLAPHFKMGKELRELVAYKQP
jgi:integration host factor subunit beta